MNILQYIVQISDLGFTNAPQPPWNQDTSYLARVLAVIDNAGWLKHCTYYKIDGRKPRPFVSLDDFIPCTQGWKSLLHLSNQMDMDESYHAEIYASFHPRWNALDFFIVFSPAFVDAGPDGFLARSKQFILDLYAEFAADGLLGREVNVQFVTTDHGHHPRVWPPRENVWFVYGNLLDVFSRRYYQQHPDDAEALLGYDEQRKIEDFFNAPVPPGVRSAWHNDDLRIIEWVDDLRDAQHILARCAMQEQWLIDVLHAPLDPLRGDLPEDASPYVTWYQTKLDLYGYKLIQVAADGSFDTAMVQQLLAWKQAGQLPDGRTLKKVCLVTENLAAAVCIYRQVIAMGIHEVYYLREPA